MSDEKTSTDAQADAGNGQKVQLKMNDSNMETVYANVTNVWGTREEIMLDFGMSSIRRGATPSVDVEITKRVVLSPYNAKRFAVMMSKAIKGYEEKFNTIDISRPANPPEVIQGSDDIG